MNSEKPLNVRVAEALGMEPCGAWKLWGTGLSGPEFVKIGTACTHANCYPESTPPPYGDDTPEGWACTGPLIERFELSLRSPEAPPFIPTRYWEVELGDLSVGQTGSACAAVAEWVAHFVREGKVMGLPSATESER